MNSKSHANKNKLVTFLIPERGQTRLLNFSASTSGNKKRKSVCWRGTYELFRWKQSMNSKSHANKHKLVTFLIPERGQTRLLNFSASTSGNKKKENVCWRGTYVLFRWKQSIDAKSHANKHKLVTFLTPERGQTRLLNFSASTSGNKKRKGVCWRGTYNLFRWKQSINSKSHANKHKLVTFLIPEHRQNRVAHQRHEISSERRSKKISNIGTYLLSSCRIIRS